MGQRPGRLGLAAKFPSLPNLHGDSAPPPFGSGTPPSEPACGSPSEQNAEVRSAALCPCGMAGQPGPK